MKRKRHDTNLKRNEIKTKCKQNYNELTANLKRAETERNARIHLRSRVMTTVIKMKLKRN